MNNKSSKQIKIAAILSYIAIFINIIAGILYTPWMIQQIGESSYGLYTLAISIIAFFTFDFGLGEAISRFLSKFNISRDEKSKTLFLGITFKLYIIIDIIIFLGFLIVFIFSDNFYSELSNSELEKFRIVFVIAGVYALGTFPFKPLDGILIAHERFVLKKILELIHRIFTVLTMVVVLLLGYKLYALVAVNALVGVFVLILKLSYLKKNSLIKIDYSAKDKVLMKEILLFSGWTSVAAFASRLTFTVTPTILAALSGSLQIAYFGVASIIEGYFFTFSAALNGLFLPRVTKITYNNNNAENDLQELMVKIGRLNFIVIALIFIGFISVGKEFLSLWLNEDFEIVYYAVILMVSPLVITLTQNIGLTALTAKNMVKYNAIAMLLVGGISIMFAFILSASYGVIGSALGIFIGTTVGGVIYINIIYSKKLNLNLKQFFINVHIKMIIPVFISLSTGCLINSLMKEYSWINLAIKIVLITSMYFITSWFFSFNKYEKGLILLPIKNFIQFIYSR